MVTNVTERCEELPIDWNDLHGRCYSDCLAIMENFIEKIIDAFFPTRVRPYLTFRWITVFVLLLFAWDVAFKYLIRLTPDMVALFQAQAEPFMRPAVLIPYDIAVLVGFWWIYVSRRNQKYYLGRVVLYGMLLAAVGAQLAWWLVPFRT